MCFSFPLTYALAYLPDYDVQAARVIVLSLLRPPSLLLSLCTLMFSPLLSPISSLTHARFFFSLPLLFSLWSPLLLLHRAQLRSCILQEAAAGVHCRWLKLAVVRVHHLQARCAKHSVEHRLQQKKKKEARRESRMEILDRACPLPASPLCVDHMCVCLVPLAVLRSTRSSWRTPVSLWPSPSFRTRSCRYRGRGCSSRGGRRSAEGRSGWPSRL